MSHDGGKSREFVEPFARAGADNITFHIEATDNPDGKLI